jgi:hypothetical protein
VNENTHSLSAQLQPPDNNGKEMLEITEPRSPKKGLASLTMQADTAAISWKKIEADLKTKLAS